MKKERQIYTVTGKTGRGKSHFLKEFLIPELEKKQPVIIADSMNEYQRGAKFETVDSFYIKAISAELNERSSIVRVKSDTEAKKLFAFSRLSGELTGSPHALVIEEASKYCSPYKIDSYLNELVSYGRHWGVSLVFVAQRFAQLNKIITSQADINISFQQTEHNDLNGIKPFFNDIDKIRTLDKKQFVVFGDVEKNSQLKEATIHELNGKKLTYEKWKS